MIALGPLFTVEHTPTQVEFELFARVSGDDNPIHVDPDFSARTRFGRTVSHGMLIYSLLWAELRRRFPQAVMTGQNLMFPHPAYAGEPLRLTAIVDSLAGSEARIVVRVTRVADDTPVTEAVTLLDLGAA